MLLFDTCALLWLDSDPGQLSPSAKQAVRDHAASLFVSSASALEIAIKCRKGKLVLPVAPERWFPAMLAAHGIREIPLTSPIAIHSAQLPLLHFDPFDRIIVATAQLSAAALLSPDPLIHAYPDTRVVW